MAHEVLALEILTLLLETPTNDSVECAIAFLKECGQYLTEVSPKGMHSVFERMRSVLHEGDLDKRTQYMIEVMFAVRKDGFKDHPKVSPTMSGLVASFKTHCVWPFIGVCVGVRVCRSDSHPLCRSFSSAKNRIC